MGRPRKGKTQWTKVNLNDLGRDEKQPPTSVKKPINHIKKIIDPNPSTSAASDAIPNADVRAPLNANPNTSLQASPCTDQEATFDTASKTVVLPTATLAVSQRQTIKASYAAVTAIGLPKKANTASRLKLQDLPEDVLLPILSYALTHYMPLPVYPNFRHQPSCHHGAGEEETASVHKKPSLNDSILYTCRRFYHLGIPLYYTLNTFALDLNRFFTRHPLIQQWPSQMGLKSLALEKVKTLIVRVSHAVYNWEDTTRALKPFKNLEVVIIDTRDNGQLQPHEWAKLCYETEETIEKEFAGMTNPVWHLESEKDAATRLRKQSFAQSSDDDAWPHDRGFPLRGRGGRRGRRRGRGRTQWRADAESDGVSRISNGQDAADNAPPDALLPNAAASLAMPLPNAVAHFGPKPMHKRKLFHQHHREWHITPLPAPIKTAILAVGIQVKDNALMLATMYPCRCPHTKAVTPTCAAPFNYARDDEEHTLYAAPLPDRCVDNIATKITEGAARDAQHLWEWEHREELAAEKAARDAAAHEQFCRDVEIREEQLKIWAEEERVAAEEARKVAEEKRRRREERRARREKKAKAVSSWVEGVA